MFRVIPDSVGNMSTYPSDLLCRGRTYDQNAEENPSPVWGQALGTPPGAWSEIFWVPGSFYLWIGFPWDGLAEPADHGGVDSLYPCTDGLGYEDNAEEAEGP